VAKATFGPSTFGSATFVPATLAGPGIRSWFCECCKTCTYFFDGFERDDDSDLGDDWSEESGLWEILDRRLVTSSASAFAKCLAGQIQGQNLEDGHVVSALLRGDTAGDEVWLVASYLNTNNYVYAKVTFGSPSTLELWRLSEGTPTQLGATVTLSVNHAGGSPDSYDGMVRAVPVAIIFGEGGICLWYGQLNQDVLDSPVDPLPLHQAVKETGDLITDNTCGVMTGASNTGTVYVDDFRLQHHGENQPGCAACQVPPSCVKVTISGIAAPTDPNHADDCQILNGCGVNFCECLNGTYYLPHNEQSETTQWYRFLADTNPNFGYLWYCIGNSNLRIALEVVDGGGTYTIRLLWPVHSSPGFLGITYDDLVLESSPIDSSTPYHSWDEETLTLTDSSGDDGSCDFSAISATVTAVHGDTCPYPHYPCYLCDDCGDIDETDMVMELDLEDDWFPTTQSGASWSDANGTYFLPRRALMYINSGSGLITPCTWAVTTTAGGVVYAEMAVSLSLDEQDDGVPCGVLLSYHLTLSHVSGTRFGQPADIFRAHFTNEVPVSVGVVPLDCDEGIDETFVPTITGVGFPLFRPIGGSIRIRGVNAGA